MSLDDLPVSYAAARAEAARWAVPIADVVLDTCRYCGRHWRAWMGGALDGHSRCVVPLAFQRQVLALYRRSPGLSVRRIAEAIGVTRSVVESWIKNANVLAGES